MWASVSFQWVFRPLWVLAQTHTLRGLRLAVRDFGRTVRCRRVALQHLTVAWQLLRQRPLLQPGTPEVSDLGKHARGCRVGLLASYFPGVVSSGGGSPGCPLQSLGLFWQLWRGHALLLLHPDGFRVKQMTSYNAFQISILFRELRSLTGLSFRFCSQLIISANFTLQASLGTVSCHQKL